MVMTKLESQLFTFFIVLFVLCLTLTACSTPTNPDPVIPPGVDTGSLQVTVVGLPAGVDAAVEVVGPENYQQTVKRSQTLQVPTGTYTVSIASVTASGITYAGELDVESVDVARSQTASVTATYTTVGQVGPNEIAPGITRTGQVPEGALKDYQIKGVQNVPLLFDFTGTESDPGIAQYTVEFYKADDLSTRCSPSATTPTAFSATPSSALPRLVTATTCCASAAVRQRSFTKSPPPTSAAHPRSGRRHECSSLATRSKAG